MHRFCIFCIFSILVLNLAEVYSQNFQLLKVQQVAGYLPIKKQSFAICQNNILIKNKV
jgi:hypothetical protein